MFDYKMKKFKTIMTSNYQVNIFKLPLITRDDKKIVEIAVLELTRGLQTAKV